MKVLQGDLSEKQFSRNLIATFTNYDSKRKLFVIQKRQAI